MTAGAVAAADKWRNIGSLVCTEVPAMSLRFSAAAVVPQLAIERGLDGSQKSWMTMSVQTGFVAGAVTLGSAMPHLLSALPAAGDGGTPPWSSVLLASSALAVMGAAIVACFVRAGPYLGQVAPLSGA